MTDHTQSRKEYSDAYSQQVFLAFKEALFPLLANIAPEWLLHHMEMQRHTEFTTHEDRVEIRLVIKPIGQARFIDPDADLVTGSKRLNHNRRHQAS